jgi:Asp-tRNA(Asn)/Glu-tRNA(Gln) amidotransferase A subunit family amidase
VADAQLLFEALCGFDPECPGSRRVPIVDRDLQAVGRMRLGVWADLSAEPVEPDIAAVF